MVQMKRTLSKRDFDAAVKRLSISDRAVDMARRVLIAGERQVDVAKEFEVSRGAVSHQVRRVWRAHVDNQEIPAGFERLENVVLPADKAAILRTWLKDEERKSAREKS